MGKMGVFEIHIHQKELEGKGGGYGVGMCDEKDTQLTLKLGKRCVVIGR